MHTSEDPSSTTASSPTSGSDSSVTSSDPETQSSTSWASEVETSFSRTSPGHVSDTQTSTQTSASVTTVPPTVTSSTATDNVSFTTSTISSVDSNSVSSSSASASTESATTSEPLSTDSAASMSSSTAESTPSQTFDPSNYSYYEVTLPVTFDPADPTLPPTTTETLSITPTAEPLCALPNPEGQDLRLGDSSSHRFVAKDGRIGVLRDSDFPSFRAGAVDDDAQGTMAAANQAYYAGIVFRLTAAPNGFYDLSTTIDGKVRYVGYQVADGRVVLTNTKAGALDAATPLTSIFKVSCAGELEAWAFSGLFELTWRVDSSGDYTEMVAQSPGNGQAIQITTTTSPGPISDGTPGTHGRRSSSRPRYGAMPELTGRDVNKYSEGQYPRVPSTPAGLISRARAGARGMTSNGCGSGALGKYVPQLGFGHCCDLHDFCFDNCATGQVERCSDNHCAPGQFERCNSAFYDCMSNSVCSQISWFWHPVDRAVCEAEAVFYTGVVSTGLGGDAFKEATAERCGAYCSRGEPWCYLDGPSSPRRCAAATDNTNCAECGQRCDTSKGYQCVGSQCKCTADVVNDSNNCGGCGNKCPPHTKCSGGACVCADNKCGNLCVSVLTHPRNCGACGSVCASGYCWDGACMDVPPPDPTGPAQCLPTDAVKNGGFDSLANPSPWVGSAFKGRAEFVKDNGKNAARLTTDYAENAFFEPAPSATLYQDLTLCPGLYYELTFQLRVITSGALGVSLSHDTSFTPLYGDIFGLAPPTNGGNWQGMGPFGFTAPEAAGDGDKTVQQRLYFSVGSTSFLGPYNPASMAFAEISFYPA
ncbi:uncharacterized protein B0I36DRAFT_367048 [Microdochium trichocladiopsis]|uniref:PA14 domain-containing protein n=1 Tax=Microdochium trichocladiopsis TaxID=1682393 RepID=A0A9P9BJF0_9PEZI|nr:uncharacterized protein B0I36DRAFT_367048 [Microdochium trichocladiopsis]KAH7025163.1 hypothetical protein B0I36DRAFT_367048 [Microdochium trichocladiopsis]